MIRAEALIGWLRAFQPMLAWCGAMTISAATAAWMLSQVRGDTLSFNGLFLNGLSFMAIPAAIVAMTTVWASHKLNLFRPLADIAGATLLALLIALIAPVYVSLACGFVAGLSYWIFAGCPRPPYEGESNSSVASD